ncbi:MAG: DNA repair exonuclease [Desulfovibrio sp.]|nr:DNA repair exonuclease [Desulfovibrio sp.]
MDVIRYIHAADLHLDTPFQGLSRETAQEGPLARLLQEATFTALDRLIGFCESEKPDFLVLAGDIYNQENHSVKAQLRLRDGCQRLRQAGVRVFLSHGNHDPLDSRLHTVEWPDNVTIFGPETERHCIERDGRPLAVIHGISHATTREGRNLARLFQRDQRYDCFQLGVLHCTVEGEHKADRYAPCSLVDLKATGLDAWALGHVHETRQLCQHPFIAYAGSAQGLHINESGPRGCLLVTATANDSGWSCAADFLRLGPVQWEKLDVDVEGVNHLDEIERRISQHMEKLTDSVAPSCRGIVTRVRLTGRTTLDSLLHEDVCQADLAERLHYLGNSAPGIWLKDMQVATRPLINHEEYRQREDILGEAMRLAQTMRQNQEIMQCIGHSALDPLFGHNRLRKILPYPDAGRMQALLDDAERLCMDLLEKR